jgi:hypothetical protein
MMEFFFHQRGTEKTREAKDFTKLCSPEAGSQKLGAAFTA